MSKFIDFLFGQSQEGDEPILDAKTFGSDLIHLFEEADKEEKLGVNKQPLTKALSALGIKDAGDDLELDPRGFSLICTDSNEYRNYLQLLSDPDALAKLAGLGWVHSSQGDVAQHNEPTEFRIRFLEIDVAGEDDEGKSPKTTPTKDQTNKALNDILDKGREFATTPVAVDDPSGNVDRESPDSGTSEQDGQRKGLGKEKDGSNPEGKPKGAEKGKRPEAVAKSPGNVSYRKESITEKKKDKPAHLKSKPICRHCHKELSYMGQISCPACGKCQSKSDESLFEGAHKPGCACGFCKNKGNIANLRKGNKPKTEEPKVEEPKTETEPEDQVESANDIAARLLEGPDEGIDGKRLERGHVEQTHLDGGCYGKNVNQKGKTAGKFKFPSNYKVGHEMK